MATKPVVRLDPATFDYVKFERDLLKKISAQKKTIYEASVEVLYRSETYLKTILAKKRMPVAVFFALLNHYGLQAKEYEIKPEPPKPEPAPAPVKKEEPILKNGWDCVLTISTAAGIAYMGIYKDGAKVASSRSKIFDLSDRGVVQAISYAAHMCYKVAEQKELAERASEAVTGGCSCKTTERTGKR